INYARLGSLALYGEAMPPADPPLIEPPPQTVAPATGGTGEAIRFRTELDMARPGERAGTDMQPAQGAPEQTNDRSEAVSSRRVLWLGAALDDAGQRTDTRIEVDPADLTTHGVIVGMTGSGKTGLGVVLLEEALLQRIPVLVIDPKGDMGNLLLNFPELRPDDFRPWIDTAGADSDADTVAAQTADTWRSGLESWGIDAARMRALKDAADL